MFDGKAEDLLGDDPSKYRTLWELYCVLLLFDKDPGEAVRRRAHAYARWLYGDEWVEDNLRRGPRGARAPLKPFSFVRYSPGNRDCRSPSRSARRLRSA